jgi:hypothetical protein
MACENEGTDGKKNMASLKTLPTQIQFSAIFAKTHRHAPDLNMKGAVLGNLFW